MNIKIKLGAEKLLGFFVENYGFRVTINRERTGNITSEIFEVRKF
jgi:hypothetical protein